LERANRKFKRRFEQIEQMAESQGKSLRDMSLEEMDRLWNQVKDGES